MSATLPGRDLPYMDPTLPATTRAADLLLRMTVDEKLAQLGSAWVFQFLSGEQFSPDRAAELCKNGLGQVTRIAGASSLTPRQTASVANQIQRALVERTRLGIPAIVHEEICSGPMARGSTVYPQAIGIAATFDPDLNNRIADAIRVQLRRTGVHQGLSPVLDVARDPRWGRSEETYGEDPYLVSRMGSAFVAGLQGDDLANGVIATAKHFVGYSAPEGGMNWAPAHIGERELLEVYLHPFEASVKDAGVRSVMNAYQELDGVPGAANGKLMNGLLRETWGFDGTVVSDYFSINQLAVYHRLVSDKARAAAVALNAGIDSELPSTDCYAAPLEAAIADQMVTMDMVDEAVRRTLRLKFELGLFEEPYVDVSTAASAVDTRDHRQLALEVARKSVVLLKDEGGLPLGETPGTIAVIGPNANSARNLLCDYSYPAHIESLLEMRDENNIFGMPIPDDVEFTPIIHEAVTVLDGLQSRYGEPVHYARGCNVNDDDTSGFEEAVQLAEKADVVVLVVGDKAGLTVDCTSGEGRDRSSLDLPGVQEELARAVIETGTPVVTVLVVGRPCGSQFLHENSTAVLTAWLPGQEGGQAIADVLVGDYNPGGKLPMTFPRTVGQIPAFYGHKVSGGRSHWQGDYVDGPTSPLYPFGFGLSYTRFVLDNPVVDNPIVGEEGTVTVAVTVRNEGDADGEEVVQLYIRDAEASITRPVIELKNFMRVPVESGGSRRVVFELPVGQLGFYDQNLDYVVEDGDIEFFVGTSSADLASAGRVRVKATGPIEKRFDGTRRLE